MKGPTKSAFHDRTSSSLSCQNSNSFQHLPPSYSLLQRPTVLNCSQSKQSFQLPPDTKAIIKSILKKNGNKPHTKFLLDKLVKCSSKSTASRVEEDQRRAGDTWLKGGESAGNLQTPSETGKHVGLKIKHLQRNRLTEQLESMNQGDVTGQSRCLISNKSTSCMETNQNENKRFYTNGIANSCKDLNKNCDQYTENFDFSKLQMRLIQKKKFNTNQDNFPTFVNKDNRSNGKKIQNQYSYEISSKNQKFPASTVLSHNNSLIGIKKLKLLPPAQPNRNQTQQNSHLASEKLNQSSSQARQEKLQKPLSSMQFEPIKQQELVFNGQQNESLDSSFTKNYNIFSKQGKKHLISEYDGSSVQQRPATEIMQRRQKNKHIVIKESQKEQADISKSSIYMFTFNNENNYDLIQERPYKNSLETKIKQKKVGNQMQQMNFWNERKAQNIGQANEDRDEGDTFNISNSQSLHYNTEFKRPVEKPQIINQKTKEEGKFYTIKDYFEQNISQKEVEEKKNLPQQSFCRDEEDNNIIGRTPQMVKTRPYSMSQNKRFSAGTEQRKARPISCASNKLNHHSPFPPSFFTNQQSQTIISNAKPQQFDDNDHHLIANFQMVNNRNQSAQQQKRSYFPDTFQTQSIQKHKESMPVFTNSSIPLEQLSTQPTEPYHFVTVQDTQNYSPYFQKDMTAQKGKSQIPCIPKAPQRRILSSNQQFRKPVVNKRFMKLYANAGEGSTVSATNNLQKTDNSQFVQEPNLSNQELSQNSIFF